MSSIIINEIGKQEKVDVKEKEIDEQIKKTAEYQNKDFKELKEQYEKANMMNLLQDNIRTEKIYDLLLENAVIKKGEKVKYLDLIQVKQ